jgi:hypothetical protein
LHADNNQKHHMKRTMTKTFLRSVLGLAAALAVLSIHSARATQYWEADTSRGTAVFEGLDIDETGGTVTVASDPLGQYGNVYQFYLPDEPEGFGKERTESSGTETNGGYFRMAYNTGYYIGWRAMWNPMPIDPGWVALMQMHGYGVTGQGAPLVLRAVNGDNNIYLQANANGVDTNIWHMPFRGDVWQGFVLHVFLSTNATVGYVEMWVNGVPQLFSNGQTRYYVPTWDNADGTWQDSYNKLKWGVYRSGDMDGKGSADAYMSGAAVGSTYSDVDPGINDLSGIIQIENEASGLVLNNQGSITNGSAITQWTATSSSNLDWTFLPTSGAYYQINSCKSGRDAVVQGASTANGAGIIQWSFGSSGDDQWQPTINVDGSYTFFNLHSGLVLEDPGSSTNKNTQMDQYSSNGGNNQKWVLIKQ